MATKLNGTSLFTGIYSGLTNTYSVLANASPSGVTLDGISEARSNSSLVNSLNPTFAAYMQTNFSSFDQNGDGTVSSAELSEFTNKLSTQGMTQAQLAQLGTATGMSSQTLETVLNHFAEIDTNHDGKVTTAEISAYGINSQVEKKKTEFANRAATNLSVYYGEDPSTKADSSSMVDYKFLKDGEA